MEGGERNRRDRLGAQEEWKAEAGSSLFPDARGDNGGRGMNLKAGCEGPSTRSERANALRFCCATQHVDRPPPQRRRSVQLHPPRQQQPPVMEPCGPFRRSRPAFHSASFSRQRSPGSSRVPFSGFCGDSSPLVSPPHPTWTSEWVTGGQWRGQGKKRARTCHASPSRSMRKVHEVLTVSPSSTVVTVVRRSRNGPIGNG